MPTTSGVRIATNLPRELSSLVGREAAVTEVAMLLERNPLVSLIGVGGAGKTRLAVRVAHHLARQASSLVADGVWMAELAPSTGNDDVRRTVATALGVAAHTRESFESALGDFLRARRLLLVLDNCEHVIAAVAQLAERLLNDASGLRILTTTREPLACYGEMTWPVPPLQIPADDDPHSVTTCEAGQLFVDRATAVRHNFTMSASSASAVASICRRLDGIPLAIELAAAQVATLGPVDIAARLDQLLSVAAAGPRGAAIRQRSIEAAIDWSYQLLQPPEQRLFLYLSVFKDGFTLAAAEAVADGPDTLAQLAALVNKSLVQAELQAEGTQRYRLLEPVRQFALGRLHESGNLADARQRHALYMLSVAEAAGAQLEGPDQLESQRRLACELANLREAMDYAVETCNSEIGVRFAATLSWWWSRPDARIEGRARLSSMLDLPVLADQEIARAKVMCALVALAGMQGDMSNALAWMAKTQVATRKLQNAWIEAYVLLTEGMLLLFQGDLAGVRDRSERSLALARSRGLHWLECRNLQNLAELALAAGDPALAREHISESLRIARTAGDTWSEAMAANSLGDVLRSQGDYGPAERAYVSAMELFYQLELAGAMPHQAWSGLPHNLAYVALAQGARSRAIVGFLDAAEGYQRFGPDWRGVAECVMGLGSVAIQAHQPALAARLFGAAEAALERVRSTFSPTNRTEYEKSLQSLRISLRPEVLVHEWQSGRTLDLREALLLARELEAADAPARTVADLTPRELEVARLVARGLSNRQVASELVITEKTAANHLQHVLDKLDLRSRGLLTARAADLGL